MNERCLSVKAALHHIAVRKRFSRPLHLGLVAILIGLPACIGQSISRPAPIAPPQAPNVLIFLTDDQRAQGTLRVMPQTRRWFARGGTRFSNAFATTPVCCPSRASILSGRYTHNHGVRNNFQSDHFDVDISVSKTLQETGYQTAIVGKFLNEWESKDPPGFNMWAIGPPSYHDPIFFVNGKRQVFDGYQTSVIEELAFRFLDKFERDDDDPWFLFIAVKAPHVPARPEAIYKHEAVPPFERNPAMREVNRTDKPSYLSGHRGQSWASIRRFRARQLRALMSVDDLVGDVAARLGELDESRDTLSLFMSDNGLMWGEHGRRGKQLPYTSSVKIPFMVRWPGRIAAGRKDDRIVANIDVAPTILDVATTSPRHGLDGKSFLGRSRNWILLERFRDPKFPYMPWASIRTKDIQYIEHYSNGAVAFREYYNLRKDPYQLNNLLADGDGSNDPDVSRLARRLRRARRCVGRECP